MYNVTFTKIIIQNIIILIAIKKVKLFIVGKQLAKLTVKLEP